MEQNFRIIAIDKKTPDDFKFDLNETLMFKFESGIYTDAEKEKHFNKHIKEWSSMKLYFEKNLNDTSRFETLNQAKYNYDKAIKSGYEKNYFIFIIDIKNEKSINNVQKYLKEKREIEMENKANEIKEIIMENKKIILPWEVLTELGIVNMENQDVVVEKLKESIFLYEEVVFNFKSFSPPGKKSVSCFSQHNFHTEILGWSSGVLKPKPQTFTADRSASDNLTSYQMKMIWQVDDSGENITFKANMKAEYIFQIAVYGKKKHGYNPVEGITKYKELKKINNEKEIN